ncbi:MAG TPA: AraC family transcriptional regulator [Bacteroidia bacterium]|nr:AraC family transcriptional regulator [Bacteroidia bacterium]
MQSPSFNTWTTIFLFAAIQGIFVSIVFFFVKKENRTANLLLALLTFLFSITLVEYVMYWTKYLYYFPHFMQLSDGFPFLFGVILLLYFQKVFLQHQFSKKDLWHFLPFALLIIYMLPRYLSTAEVKQAWMMGERVYPSLFYWPKFMRNIPVHWVKIAHMSLYAFWIFKMFNGLSKTNSEVRTWFNWLTGLYIGFIASYTSYFILVKFPFFNSEWDYMISFSMMFTIYFIAWFGYLQPKVFSGFTLKEAVAEPQRYKNSALDIEVSNEIAGLLDEVMGSKKLYRNSELRLDTLADEVGTSKHYLSQVINEQKGMSFFEYINSLRIAEAKMLLAEKSKKELNVIDVAYMVGFNNKVSFNNTFKKATGKTPTEFRNANSFEPVNQ